MLRLEADVPAALIGNVKLGDQLAVRIAGVTNELEGIVAEIVARPPIPNSRTFLGETGFAATPGLRSGQFGRVAVPVGEAQRDPRSRFRRVQRGQMEIVFVVANGHAQLRLVKTGARVGDEVEVVSGLDSGEPVVTDGAAILMDGQPVAVKP